MSTDAFDRNNRNYRQAGDWKSFRGNRTAVGEDGVKRRLSDGRAIIKGFRQSQGGKLMGDINEFYALQRGARAFSDPRFPGQSAGEIAQGMRSRGETTNFGGKRGRDGLIVTQDTGRPQTAQTGGGKGGFKRFRGPTDDQRKWSRKFQESQTPRTTPAPSTVDDTPGAASAKARESFLQRNKMAPPPASGPAPAPAPAPAPNFSRSALVQGAKKSGDFARVRDQYNTAAVGTGNRMDKMGNITPLSKTGGGPDGTSAFAQDKWGAGAEDIRARRDFARGEAPVQFTKAPAGGFAGQESMRSQTTQPVISATKMNPYGSATATYGPRAPGQGGTMTDPLTGKTVPMKSYLPQQSAVQGTKEPGSTSGESYYDPKKIRSSMKKGKA